MNIKTNFHQSENKSKDLVKRINFYIEELVQETDAAQVSMAMIRYLDACSKFHHYSLFNVFLIMTQYPQATVVAGYRKWQSLNRQVRPGEHGIPILAPILLKKEDSREKPMQELIGFRVVHVFDISQTDGEPLPEPPEWKSPETNALLAQRLIEFAANKGIRVILKKLAGEIQGISHGGIIELSPTAGTATLIHEIAHEMLHHKEGVAISRELKEMEAEAVAYVVTKHFGLNADASPNYVALHGNTSQSILNHLERIRDTSIEIIDSVDRDFTTKIVDSSFL
jgi:hypothetical protein